MASPSSQHPLGKQFYMVQHDSYPGAGPKLCPEVSSSCSSVVSEYQKMEQDYWNGFLAVVRTPRSGCSLKLWSNQNYTFSRLGGDMMYLQKKSFPQTKCE